MKGFVKVDEPMIRHFSLLIYILLIASLVSIWLYPPASSGLGIASLSLSLALSTNTIVHKHKGTENARPKTLKEVGVMVLTLVVIIFLGGISSMLANYQVSMRWGEIAGLVSAIAASLGVGYFVRKGMIKIFG